ncbi:unnamed protein product [Dibothriocephalus latus]|uniref:Uncharacterized protein n=1 Tax=Dibothriocephalus latus TaxID=60516 RepID=A0A3P7QET7_DIBLA|nr:unnamed protein product [Dibothriocephalus latus]
MAGIAKYAFALTVFLGGLACGIGAAPSIRVKSVRLRPEKEVYLSGDVIFHCEVVKDENGFQSIKSAPLQVRYHRNGKVWKDTGSPKRNVQLMYVDNTDMVDVVCYIQTQSTPSKVIKYKAVEKPPVFVLVPNKPTYGIGERIMACRIIHTGGNIEENCPFYMEVIDSITKQIIWDSISYVRTAEVPWIMREYKSLLRITCKGGEMEVGPKTIEVTSECTKVNAFGRRPFK